MKLKKQLLIWFTVFLICSIPFWIIPQLDILLVKPFYDANKGFLLKQLPFWNFLYTYGIFFAYLLVAIAFITIAFSYWKQKAVKWRKPAVFLIVVMLLGPGVLVNSVFKDHWGRPRPREITEFGGKQEYVKLWLKSDLGGKSFPSGHASTAFFIAIPFLFLVQRYKKWAWVFFVIGNLYGVLMGFTRLIAGGHFVSDSLWAAGMVWFVGIICFHLLGLENHFENYKKLKVKTFQRKGVGFISFGIVMPAIIIILLFATPYISNDKNFYPQKSELMKTKPYMVLADINKGNVNVCFSDSFSVNYSVLAFGFPNSKVNWNWIASDTSMFSFKNSGLLTYVKTNTFLFFDKNIDIQNQINLKRGDVTVNIPNDTLLHYLSINVKKGNVNIITNKNTKLNLQTKANVKKNNQINIKSKYANFYLKVDIKNCGDIIIH